MSGPDRVTRIIAGVARGRRLTVPRNGTRPTSDRVRESVFSSLDSELGSWDYLAVLDLFAGSGALGLEAMSRGATHGVLVEHDRQAADVCRRNAAATGLGAHVVMAEVGRWLLADPPRTFDVVFADPPYSLSDDDTDRIVAALVSRGWLADQARVLFERPRAAGRINWPSGFESRNAKRFGDTEIQRAVWYRPYDSSST